MEKPPGMPADEPRRAAGGVGRLSAADVARLAEEIQKELAGSWVQAIYQPEERLVLLHLYGRGGRRRLLLDLHPERLCVALLQEGAPPNPPQPPPFCMLLRKHLEGTRLAAAAAQEADRILYLAFDRPGSGRGVDHPGPEPGADRPGPQADPDRPAHKPPDPPGTDGPAMTSGGAPAGLPAAVLVVELTGRSANLLVEVGGALAGWMRPPAPGRGLQAGRPYRPPELREGRTAPSEPSSPAGAAPPAAAVLPSVPPPPAQAALPPPAAPAGPPSGGPAPDTLLLESLGRQWVQRFARHRLEAKRRELVKWLQQAEQRLARRLQHQQQDLQAAGEPERWRQMGELLLAYAARIPPGATEVELPPEQERSADEAALTISLDPRLSPVQNAEVYFERYRKARRTRQFQQEAIARSQAALFSVQLALTLARAAETLQDLQAIQQESRESLQAAGLAADLPADAEGARFSALGQAPSRARGEKAARPEPARSRWSGIARFRSSDGLEVLAGRSASANDRLTGAIARPDDLWLHARGLPGAHVVVRSAGRPVPARTLEEAAGLAARWSAAGPNAGPVEVDVTLRRHVRKPPGTPPGFVTYTHERTLRVHPDAAATLQPWTDAAGVGDGPAHRGGTNLSGGSGGCP